LAVSPVVGVALSFHFALAKGAIMSLIRFTHFGQLCKIGVAAWMVVIAISASHSAAQTSRPVTEPDPLKAIALLRAELIDAFNKGDVDRLLSHIDSDAVVTWQNGEVCHGPEAVRAYYDKMMAGPNHIVAKLSVNPTIDDRHVYGDWAVSWGNLHDEYQLTDGRNFRFDSRFTATIARRGDEWKVASFHASVNAFDNPILGIAEKKSAIRGGAGGGVAGLVVGAIVVLILKRRKPAAA
jgi:ketosteroid isomerase-like protein